MISTILLKKLFSKKSLILMERRNYLSKIMPSQLTF